MASEVPKVTLIDPLSTKSPQQCLAGTYCAPGASSSSGTGICPIGAYCPSGSSVPLVPSPGGYVDELGRVRGKDCEPGTYSTTKNAAKCSTCPGGYTCKSFGTVVPLPCPFGTFRGYSGELGYGDSSGSISISCKPCPAGTWSPKRASFDISDCEKCPPGRSCPAALKRIFLSNPCPDGYLCGEGSSSESMILCPAGFYCTRAESSGYSIAVLCDSGYYCGEGVTPMNKLFQPCPRGFTCPRGTAYTPVLNQLININESRMKKEWFDILQMVSIYCIRGVSVMAGREFFVELSNLDDASFAALSEREVNVFPIYSIHPIVRLCVKTQHGYLEEFQKGEIRAYPLPEELLLTIIRSIPRGSMWWTSVFTNRCSFSNEQNSPLSSCMCAARPLSRDVIQCLLNRSDSGDTPEILSSFAGVVLEPVLDVVYQVCPPFCNQEDTFFPYDDFDEMRYSYSEHLLYADTHALTNIFDGPSLTNLQNDAAKESASPEGSFLASVLSYWAVLHKSRRSNLLGRCPLGTSTRNSGEIISSSCVPISRTETDLKSGEQFISDSPVYRIYPLNLSSSSIHAGYVSLSSLLYFHESEETQEIDDSKHSSGIGQIVYPEDDPVVFNLPARSYAQITISTPEIPTFIEYERDWRLRIYANHTISPFNLPLDSGLCEDLTDHQVPGRESHGSDSSTDRDHGPHFRLQMGCTVITAPFTFNKWMVSLGVYCNEGNPTADTLCSSYGLDKIGDAELCGIYRPDGGETSNFAEKYLLSSRQPTSFTLSLHSLVDLQILIEVHILNGSILPHRFHFINSVSVNVDQPHRERLYTTDTFVTHLRDDTEVLLPLNLPEVPKSSSCMSFYQQSLTTYGETLWNHENIIPGWVTRDDGNINFAQSQSEVFTKLFVSWLPEDNPKFPLTACMSRSPNPITHSELFQGERKSIYLSHLPFVSNCRGYGAAVPLFKLLSRSIGCTMRSTDATEIISVYSLGVSGVGDTCDDRNILECVLDEIPNERGGTPRWFESTSGTILFWVSRSPVSINEYAGLSNKMLLDASIPIIVGEELQAGLLFKTVRLSLDYWQISKEEKYLLSGVLDFSDFRVPSQSQMDGSDIWTYNLIVNYTPQAHSTITMNFSFGLTFYIFIFIFVSFLYVTLLMGHHAYLGIFSKKYPKKIYRKMQENFKDGNTQVIIEKTKIQTESTRRDAKETDIRDEANVTVSVNVGNDTEQKTSKYHRISDPLKCSSLILIAVSLPTTLLVFLVKGSFASFYLPFWTCSAGYPAYMCRYGILDGFSSSWRGESSFNATSYGERRAARIGTLLVVIGSIAIYVSIGFSKSKSQMHSANNLEYEETSFASEREKNKTFLLTFLLWVTMNLLFVEASFGENVSNNLSIFLIFLHLVYPLMYIILQRLIIGNCGNGTPTSMALEVMRVVPFLVLFQTNIQIFFLYSASDLVGYLLSSVLASTLDFCAVVYFPPHIQNIRRVVVCNAGKPIARMILFLFYLKNGISSTLYEFIRICFKRLSSLFKLSTEGRNKGVVTSEEGQVGTQPITDSPNTPPVKQIQGNSSIHKGTDDPTFHNLAVQPDSNEDHRNSQTVGTSGLINHVSHYRDVFMSTSVIVVQFNVMGQVMLYGLYEELGILKLYGIPLSHVSYYVLFNLIFSGVRLLSMIVITRTIENDNKTEKKQITTNAHIKYSSYYTTAMFSFGGLLWTFGFHVLLSKKWNPFDDPATVLIVVVSVIICTVLHRGVIGLRKQFIS